MILIPGPQAQLAEELFALGALDCILDNKMTNQAFKDFVYVLRALLPPDAALLENELAIPLGNVKGLAIF